LNSPAAATGRASSTGCRPGGESRALGINPRTLAILEPSGATHRLIRAGTKVRAAQLHTATRDLFRIDLTEIGGRYPFILMLPQGEVEAGLVEVLAGLGIAVEWRTELLDLELTGSGASARLSAAGAPPETLQLDFVIGADGAHSKVRKSAGLDFAGSAYESEWGLADAIVETALPLDTLHAFDLAPVLLAMLPIRGQLVRFFSDHSDVLRHVPAHISVKEVRWETTFRISHRQVPEYQKGPVFLAGDAAHIHSPVGGRGMNLGIEDAAWLAWLISEGKTERYTGDRWPVARQVLRTVDPATRFLSSDRFAPRLLRRNLLPQLVRVPAIRRRALRRLAALDTPEPPWLPERRDAPGRDA
jgi:2-polyprenyl-6-methoxyphenol hydroxylase-like FAD-dependent oxidoreductase